MKKICMILVLCLMATFAYGQGKSNGILIVAAGQDQDIGYYVPTHRAVTLIKAEWSEFSAANLPTSGQIEFSTKIFDESGEKVYTMEGELELESAMVVPPGFMSSYCEVRNVTWVDFWFVMGWGLVKTTEAITIDYRGVTTTLPDTEGEYIPKLIVVVVSPEGEYFTAECDECYWGGWSWAGIFDPITMTRIFGGITWLRNFLDTRTP